MIHKLLILFIICACVLAPKAQAITPEPQPIAAHNAQITKKTTTETLAYNIYFHLGFIWAKAGYGELSYFKENTRDGQTQFHGQLAAKTLSVVEHIMKVRDTLDCWFNADMVPLEFRKGTHEGSYNSVAHYAYTPYLHNKEAGSKISNIDSTKVLVNRWIKKGKDPSQSESHVFSNKGVAYDMLSVFYSIRRLDFSKMKKGKTLRYVCYDGVKSQIIKVEFQGEEECELRSDKKYKSYLVHLTFDTKGQNATPLKVWLSKTPDHRPIKAVIALKRIGSVQCEIEE